MPEKKAIPTLEEVALQYCQGDTLKAILDFNTFLTENGLKAKKGSGASKNFQVRYKSKLLCKLKITGKDFWTVSIALYKEFTDTETFEKRITGEQRELLLNKFCTEKPCVFSYGPCTARGTEFLGKNYDAFCNCNPFRQSNPTANELEFTKQFILLYKKILDDIAAEKKATK